MSQPKTQDVVRPVFDFTGLTGALLVIDGRPALYADDLDDPAHVTTEEIVAKANARYGEQVLTVGAHGPVVTAPGRVVYDAPEPEPSTNTPRYQIGRALARKLTR